MSDAPNSLSAGALCQIPLEYSPRLSASVNIPNFRDIILNVHLTVSKYLYNSSVGNAWKFREFAEYRYWGVVALYLEWTSSGPRMYYVSPAIS